MGPYDVSVSVYYYGGGSGHIGIGVNGGPSMGLYATSNSAFGLILGLSAEGQMFPDALVQKTGPSSVVIIPVTADQAAAVNSELKALKQTPPDFHLYTQNCASTAGQVLSGAGISNVPNSLIPIVFTNSFGH
jgi:hypothetical protein